MSLRFQIAAMVFLMVQAIVFGAGLVLVLATPLSDFAMQLMPWVVVTSALISAPISWMLAPRLRLRFWQETNQPDGDFISGPSKP
jgi:hypothetical protein